MVESTRTSVLRMLDSPGDYTSGLQEGTQSRTRALPECWLLALFFVTPVSGSMPVFCLCPILFRLLLVPPLSLSLASLCQFSGNTEAAKGLTFEL